MLTPARLFAIAVIFGAAAIGWVVLGGSITYRTETAGGLSREDVGNLWGSAQVQQAPSFRSGNASLPIAGSDVVASFDLEQRKRGLLWYATYVVDLDAAYRVINYASEPRRVEMRWPFPAPDGVYDGFTVQVDGVERPVTYTEGAAIVGFDVPAGEAAAVRTTYRTQGLDEWRYNPTPDGVGVIRDFSLTMNTDFADVDFPTDAVSPTEKSRAGDGWTLVWSYDSLVSGRPVGLVMPKPLNPGPLAARISTFAPVSLLFYFAAVVLVSSTRAARVHPMNYGFLAAAFFAFHLLFAYLVDRIDIHTAFAVASVVSVALCAGYLRLFVSDRRALLELAASQLVFLVLFSFSFFFEGLTGLAVTIGSVLTLAYFMARTGRVDWERVFAKGAEERRARDLAKAGYAPPPSTGPV